MRSIAANLRRAIGGHINELAGREAHVGQERMLQAHRSYSAQSVADQSASVVKGDDGGAGVVHGAKELGGVSARSG